MKKIDSQNGLSLVND